ncbi:MAG: putative 4Fe-4S ferredoxin, RnfC [Treponematales bacterium]
MGKVYTFPRGGILFQDLAIPRRDTSVLAYLPALSIIPLIQHEGARASPVVSIGDRVKDGTLVARGQGAGSANIHASVPGKVIRTVSWKMHDGRTNDALVIRMEGAFDRLGKKKESFPWEGLSPHEIKRIIKECGVVNMEREGTPVADTLAGLRAAEGPVTLVVSCVFDDPWFAADYAVCSERPEAVTEGAAILCRASGASGVIYAVSKREEDVGAALFNTASSWNTPASLVLVGNKYPQSNRRELEMVLKNYAEKEGVEIGEFFVMEPATLAAVYDAVKFRKPVVERYVAVGGTAVKTPQVMKVRIGTRAGDVFAECGGFVGKPKFVASGSPLQGYEITDLDEPVTKTCFALFALLEKEWKKHSLDNCIGCGECRKVCPVGIDPEDLYKWSRHPQDMGDMLEISAAGAGNCHGCGCCEVVCPSMLPLVSSITGLEHRRNNA